ncbi:alpha/beta hydrolase [Haloplanus halobius]|uniref:alpha/beta hydrolase n=1 Tax=Haloplanus halobius TaxID=2934938 RepID=UPI00200DE907|nr:alpha/beta hydrolase [Haloplanus sp. XH21]
MSDVHADEPVMTAGTDPSAADAAVVLLHGRGASARSILGMASEFHRPGVAFLAPQAANNEWYPNSFLAPVADNEPHLSSALGKVEATLDRAADAGIPTERTALLGFSQGACLASEFAARNPTRYGGIVALSGGLIGDSVDPDDYTGSLDGTPAFFGCSDVDPHIPEERVHASTTVYDRLDADVTERIYEGMGHTVNEDEIAFVASLVEDL